MRRSSWIAVVAASLAAACAPAQENAGDDWLVSREGLCYGYAPGTGDPKQPRLIAFDEEGNPTVAGRDASFVANRGGGLIPRGTARYDHHFGMATLQGSFLAASGANRIVQACKESGMFTFLAWVSPPKGPLAEEGTLLWLGPTSGTPNFELIQKGREVTVRLRVAGEGSAKDVRKTVFVRPDDRPYPLAVIISNGVLRVGVDGAVAFTETLGGDLSRWRASELVFGDAYQPGRNWPGKLEALAFYSRALGDADIQQQRTRLQTLLQSRKLPPRVRVKAKLTAQSRIPEPDSIKPYYQALSLFQYAVEEVLEGEVKGDVVAVAHWVVMDSQKLPIGERKVGDTFELTLEPYDLNPQLKTDYWVLSDLDDPDLPVWFDVAGVP